MAILIGIASVEATSNSTAITWDDTLGVEANLTDEPATAWKNWHLPHCEPATIIVQDYATEAEYEACFISPAGAQLAIYDNNGVRRYAARKYGDNTFHRVSNITAPSVSFMASPDGPLLTWSYSGQDALTLRSIANPLLHVGSLSSPNLDPDRIGFYTGIGASEAFTDSSGTPLRVEAAAVSKNGKYAIAQVENIGIVRIDLTTRSLKLITKDTQILRSTILAIADTGDRIAAIDLYTSTARIYTGLDTCGADTLAADLSQRTQRCYHVDFSSHIMPHLTSSTLYNPEFLSDQSSFVAHIWNETDQKSRKLTITPDPDTYRLDYLAMGDSYSSGEGDAERSKYGYSYYLPNTDTPEDDCHISSRSYPFRLRDTWQISQTKMKSVACSGARILPDYNGSLTNYYGQGGNLSDHPNIEDARKAAVKDFFPGRAPQLEFVKKYKPTLITLTGGGNDIGFVNIITYCATPILGDVLPWINSDCRYAIEGSELEKTLYDSIDTQYTYTKKLIQDIKLASPITKVVIIGYPSFVTHESALPCVLNSGLLSIAEIKMMNKMVTYMNTMLQRVAHDTGVTFVDITDALNGGRICEGSRYMTGVWKYKTSQARYTEQFHPNALGHWQIAQVIRSANIYRSDDTVPAPGTYDPTKSHKSTLQAPFLKNGYGTKQQGLRIQTPPGILSPNSSYTPTTYSDPKLFGNFTTSSDGSVDITLPLDDVSIGRHVLVINGTSTDGNPIRLYQHIEVRASSTDADGDGVLDENDNCQFITEWYDEVTGENVCLLHAEKVDRASPLSESLPKSVLQEKKLAPATQLSRARLSSTNTDMPIQPPTASPVPTHTADSGSQRQNKNQNYGMIVTIIILTLGTLGGMGYVYGKVREK